MRILVINGPNLNFLGIRDTKIYGSESYATLCELLNNRAKELEVELDLFQSNSEGTIIDRLQQAYFDKVDGIIINPGAYTHYSYAILDAISSIHIPTVEVHISDIHSRESFRNVSVTAAACVYQIVGQGLQGYIKALEYFVKKERERNE